MAHYHHWLSRKSAQIMIALKICLGDVIVVAVVIYITRFAFMVLLCWIKLVPWPVALASIQAVLVMI